MQIQSTHTPNAQLPLVSFIVPVYNVPADMLRECIESIRALQLRPCEREIIVVDDGSDPPALSHLNDCLDDILYLRKKNEGLSIARNIGIQTARGRYIQFVDGDDRLIISQYEHCLDLIRYQNTDMVMFDFTRNQEETSLSYDDLESMSGTELMRHHNIKGSACGYIFKSNMLGELRFTPDIYHEDEEFTPLLLIRAERVIATNAKAYFYRTRSDSITTGNETRKTLKRLNDAKAVVVRLHTAADRFPNNERIAMQRRIAQLTMDYIYNVITLTQSRHYLDRKLEELRHLGLFPLPDQDYTKKYAWFRRMTNSNLGLSILMRTLPKLKRER